MYPFTDNRSLKQHITVCLSALANGEKLKPFIVVMDKIFSNEFEHILGHHFALLKRLHSYIRDVELLELL